MVGSIPNDDDAKLKLLPSGQRLVAPACKPNPYKNGIVLKRSLLPSLLVSDSGDVLHTQGGVPG